MTTAIGPLLALAVLWAPRSAAACPPDPALRRPSGAVLSSWELCEADWDAARREAGRTVAHRFVVRQGLWRFAGPRRVEVRVLRVAPSVRLEARWGRRRYLYEGGQVREAGEGAGRPLARWEGDVAVLGERRRLQVTWRPTLHEVREEARHLLPPGRRGFTTWNVVLRRPDGRELARGDERFLLPLPWRRLDPARPDAASYREHALHGEEVARGQILLWLAVQFEADRLAARRRRAPAPRAPGPGAS